MPPPTTTQRNWSSRPASFPHAGHPAVPSGSAAVYRRREPVRTPLYPIVQYHLESFLALAEEADGGGVGVPGWVEEDFRDHASRGARLRCGILAHGLARLRCDGCAAERLVAFSCKGRGVCPSCNTRRMFEVAAHLGDAVLPPVPVRQWVLSLTCGGEMRIISFITLPSTVERILLHLDLPHRPPLVSPTRGPPQAELHLDPSPAFDLAAPDAIPEFEFDQSSPQDWEF